MTKAQREQVEQVIAQVIGQTEWWGEALTEAQCDACCEHCPLAQQCEEQELYWGCAVWEESMGDDL